MPRPFASAALGVFVLGAVFCGGPRPDPATDRERAYRASNRGVALLEQFRYPEALAAFREALAIDASLAVGHVNLSLALFYTQNLEDAAREANEAARRLPSAPQPPYILGLVARAQNQNQEAVPFFERVRQIDPRDVGTNVNLGQIYLEERRYTEAIAILRSAVGDEPYNVTAAYNLGLALTRSGQAAEGQRLLEQSQALRTTGYAVTFGSGYLEQGRYAEAMASTGAETEIIDPALPSAAFTAVTVASVPAREPVAASPFGRPFSAGELTDAGARRLAAALGGGLTPIDFDSDGDLDIFIAAPDGQRLIRNGRGTWVDVTATGLDGSPPNSVPVGGVAADYDNDGAADLFVLRYGRSSLYRNDGNGRFTEVTGDAGLPSYPFLPGAAAFVDVDHDGDVDLLIAGLADLAATRQRAAGRALIFPREFAPAPLQLLRNNRDGTFTDITRAAGLESAGHAIAVVPTDYDNRREIDLLIVNRDRAPVLFKNLRDGTFRDVAAEVGLGAAGGPNNEVAAVAAGDVNKDDFPDFFFAGAGGGVFALSDARGRFTLTPAAAAPRSATASQFIDYDNDGLLDLLTWSTDGPHIVRNLGRDWSDVTASAVRGTETESVVPPVSARALAVADLDGDGTTDFATLGLRSLSTWRNSGDGRHRSLRVQLRGLASNRSGAGSKIQVRAGSLSARLETSAATPAVAPADLVFGLGQRAGADVVRVLWPSGILQAEAAGSSESGASSAPPSASPTIALSIDELDRKPSSCPFLFTWNGERFAFVTDFIGAGEMGYWHSPAVYSQPDPVEYVRIRGDQLRPKDGHLGVRVTNELEETLFLDRVQLVAVAHPREMEVFPNEGMTDPPKPFRLYGVREVRVPVRASDDHGHDLTERIARLDRRYVDDFTPAPFRGYAAEHTLTLDLGPTRRPTVLLLTGWTDYAFSSDNVAAYQAGLSLTPPSLQIRDAGGAWRVAAADIGIPVGRPQTIAVDLMALLRPGEHEIRIVTNMRIYWDQILVATGTSTDRLSMIRLDPRAADLRSRGFSAEVRPDGTEPASYDYERVTRISPWKAISGRYTREGDVRELLARSDDMFVIAKAGDEIALEFDAAVLDSLPQDWTRTFLLLADGFSKEMDINSASPDTVEPLPFRRMTRYPYSAPEQYPDTPEHRRYRETYNTRAVVRLLPPLQIGK